MKQVVIYSKPNCCLCDDAKHLIERARELLTFAFEEKSILDDEALLRKYRYRVPVVLIDGTEMLEGRIDEAMLISCLSETK